MKTMPIARFSWTVRLLLVLASASWSAVACSSDEAVETDSAATMKTSSSSAGQAPASGDPDRTEPAVEDRLALTDETLEEYRRDLLTLAYRTASALPLQPHVKTRSRAQQSVVEACLELGQLRRAETVAAGIEHWRQGMALALLGTELARQGRPVEVVEPWLERASRNAEAQARQPNSQAWRRERVRARIAQAYRLLGEAEKVATFEAGIQGSESGRLLAGRAEVMEREQVLATIDSFESLLAAGDLDQVRGALKGFERFYGRFYEEDVIREALEVTIQASWKKVPREVAIDTLMGFAEIALAHGDSDRALSHVGEAQQVFDAAVWLPEHRVPRMAEMAEFRHRAGDVETARQGLEAARAIYDAERAKIVDIDRAGALRPLAEAYQSIGEPGVAATLYRRAIEDGNRNPNSRPRAEDLCATCLSMALHELEPDATLWARLKQVFDALAEPW